MADQFRQWLTSELERRHYSQVELAKATGMSQPFISRVLHGERFATADFCIKVAQALSESPEKVLRLAGILPVAPASEDDALRELVELARNLSPEDQREILEYVRFRYQRRKG